MSTASTAALPSPGATPTGDQVVQELPWRWNVQGKIFIIGGLGFMFDAWDVTLNGFLIPLLAKEWDLGLAQVGLVGTANLIGMALGAFVWGGIADAIGRRKAFAWTVLIFSLFTVLGALSPNFEVFLLLRFIAGFGLGGCIPVDYAMVGEFTPRAVRGKVLTAMDGWWPVGATLCGLTSAVIASQYGGWRTMMALMVLPGLLLFWIRRSVPESPLYLVKAGRNDEARAVIEDLVRRTGARPGPWTLPASSSVPTLSMWSVGKQLPALWRFDWKITLTSWSLFLTVLLVYYGAITWMPKILIEQGHTETRAFMATTGMTAIGILGVALSTALVEKVGRKWVLGVSAPLSALLLVAFANLLELPAASQAALLGFGFMIQVAIPVLYAYVSELYPTELRGSGFGWASTVSRVGAGFVPLIFGSLLWPVFGLAWTFALMGLLVGAAVLFMAFFAPETTSRSLK